MFQNKFMKILIIYLKLNKLFSVKININNNIINNNLTKLKK